MFVKYIKSKLKLILIFGYKVFKFSLDNEFNFFKLINIILTSSIRYNYLFDNYNVKFYCTIDFLVLALLEIFYLKKNVMEPLVVFKFILLSQRFRCLILVI